MRFRFSVRDLLWLTHVVALSTAWGITLVKYRDVKRDFEDMGIKFTPEGAMDGRGRVIPLVGPSGRTYYAHPAQVASGSIDGMSIRRARVRWAAGLRVALPHRDCRVFARGRVCSTP